MRVYPGATLSFIVSAGTFTVIVTSLYRVLSPPVSPPSASTNGNTTSQKTLASNIGNTLASTSVHVDQPEEPNISSPSNSKPRKRKLTGDWGAPHPWFGGSPVFPGVYVFKDVCVESLRQPIHRPFFSETKEIVIYDDTARIDETKIKGKKGFNSQAQQAWGKRRISVGMNKRWTSYYMFASEWEVNFKPTGRPVGNNYVFKNQTAFFIMPVFPENLHHFWEDMFVRLYFVMKRTGHLDSAHTSQIVYRTPMKIKKYSSDIGRYESIVRALPIQFDHVAFFELEDKTCFSKAVFGYLPPHLQVFGNSSSRDPVEYVRRALNLTTISLSSSVTKLSPSSSSSVFSSSGSLLALAQAELSSSSAKIVDHAVEDLSSSSSSSSSTSSNSSSLSLSFPLSVLALSSSSSSFSLLSFINITIVNRSIRRILNADQLSTAVHETLVQRRIAHEVHVVNFEGMTMYEQASIAVRTDIMIGVQGAGLQWAMFMNPGSLLVEISWPQRYWKFYYETFAKHYGIRYRAVVARDVRVNWHNFEQHYLHGKKATVRQRKLWMGAVHQMWSLDNIWKAADVNVPVDDTVDALNNATTVS